MKARHPLSKGVRITKTGLLKEAILKERPHKTIASALARAQQLAKFYGADIYVAKLPRGYVIDKGSLPKKELGFLKGTPEWRVKAGTLKWGPI